MTIPKTVPETVVFEGFLVLEPDSDDLARALRDADHSPDAAFRRLEWMAGFNGALQPMPSGLHAMFSRAVERAGQMRTPAMRNRVFLQQLGLLPKSRPAAMSFMEVGEWLRKRPIGESRTQAIKAAAQHFGISQTTARSYRDRYEEARALGVQYSNDRPPEN